MRKLLIVTALLALTSQAALAETITATVNGMVCAFCATGIEKKFRQESSVEDVKVDLDTKLVTIHLKKDQPMDDKKITDIITDAGYSVTDIKHDTATEVKK